MKWIKYNIAQSIIGDDVICTPKKVGYSEANLAIARQEAYMGEYTIEDDGLPEPPKSEIPTKISQLENDSGYVTGKDLTEAAKVLATKTTISKDVTSGAKSIALTLEKSNTEYRFLYASGIDSLALSSSGTFGQDTEAYYSIVFRSAAIATTITNTINAYFTGDDCADGKFYPVATKWYDLGIWWNGIGWQAAVRGA